jgi:hypothetical protein
MKIQVGIQQTHIKIIYDRKEHNFLQKFIIYVY